jgi:hypothetical protein
MVAMKRLPFPFRRHPGATPRGGGREGRILIDPTAAMVAIDAGGGEVSDPFQVLRIGKGIAADGRAWDRAPRWGPR